MDTNKLRKDLRDGKPIDIEALLDSIDRLSNSLAEAVRKIEDLSKSNKVNQPYSMDSHENREEQKKKDRVRKKQLNDKRGRKPNNHKLAIAVRTESVFPPNFSKSECILSHTRPIWRLENNKAVVVAYEVWMHKATKTYGRIPGVIGRSGYGMEFILAVAFQVYTLGLSLDKVVLLTQFFQNLKLSKSQIDAMLRQLSKHLESEFDNLCSLVANSMIVHADETSWSIHSVWAFVTEQARVLLHGVHKDAATLEKVLSPANYKGLVISDDAAVYSKFNKMQKCWAHLLRKSIRICLLEPGQKQFETLRDGLLEIFRDAKRLRLDSRYSEDGRHNAMIELQNKLYRLIEPECEKHFDQSYDGAMEDYRLLLAELLRLNAEDQLFTFVTTADAVRPNGTTMKAEGTNNEAERTLRLVASARNTDRASKTISGARRRTVIVSTIESIRCFINRFTLENVVQEILSWQQHGMSCFERRLNSIEESIRCDGMLGKLYPKSA